MGNVASILRQPDLTRITIPSDYVTPDFPSLYTPELNGEGAFFLYYAEDMWRFTMLWSVIIIGAIHLACGVVGGLVFARKHPLVALTIPVVALGTGMLMAFISSSIVGFALAALYNSAHLQMATWVPFIFALVQAFIMVLGSYNTLSAIL